MIHRYLTLITMMACGGMPCEKGICINPEGPNPYTADAIDAYVDTLDATLAAEGYTAPGEFASVLDKSRVTWVDAYTFECGGKDVAGCYDGYMIRATVETCLGETSLAHEMVHAYLYRTGREKDADVDHSADIWNSRALLPLLKNFCGDKYKHRTYVGGL